MAHARNIVFRIFYSTSFTIVFLVLIAFVCISPADVLYRSYQRRRIVDIFIIAGVYIVTALIAALIYASRLYTTRSILKDIPKTYVPLDADELPGSKTWRLVSDTVKRSAVIAQQTRPRAWRVEKEVEGAKERIDLLLRPDTRKNGDHTLGEPRWGLVEHRGWSSPASDELPDLQYDTVVAQLTDLVEAKAVSLAPVDPTAILEGGDNLDGLPVPDPRVIEALARPDSMGMRAYVARLIDMDVVEPGELTTSFLTLYERARFAVEPLSGGEFKLLMRLFADLLRAMKQLNLDLLDLDVYDSSELGPGDGEYDDAKSIATKSSRRSRVSFASSISGSVRHHVMGSRRMSDGSVRVRHKGGG